MRRHTLDFRGEAASPRTGTGLRRAGGGVRAAALLALLAACGEGSNGQRASTGAVEAPPTSATAPAAPAAAAAAAEGTAREAAAVEGLGRHAEQVYTMAKADRWEAARAALDSVEAGMGADDGMGKSPRADSAAATLVALEQSVKHHQRTLSMHQANRLTRLSAMLSEPFRPRVPPEVEMLGFYGREMEIWAEARDPAQLRATAAGLRRTWASAEPRVLAHGGAAEAARFGALAARVGRAETPDEFAKLAPPVLGEVEKLEAVFTR